MSKIVCPLLYYGSTNLRSINASTDFADYTDSNFTHAGVDCSGSFL
jgi:hypothetical protein